MQNNVNIKQDETEISNVPAGRPVVEDNDGVTNATLGRGSKTNVPPDSDDVMNEDQTGKEVKDCNALFSVEELKAIIPDSEYMRILGVSKDKIKSKHVGNLPMAYLAALQPYLYFTPLNFIKSYLATLDMNPERYKSDLVFGKLVGVKDVTQYEQSYDDNDGFSPINIAQPAAERVGANAAYSGEGAIHRHTRHQVMLSKLINDGQLGDDNVEEVTLWDRLNYYQNGYPSYATKTFSDFEEVLRTNPQQWYDKSKHRFSVAPLPTWAAIVRNYKLKTRICFIRENLIKLVATLGTQTKVTYRSPNDRTRRRLFFMDRTILDSKQGSLLFDLASDRQTLIFPDVSTDLDAFNTLTLVVYFMIKCEHEADFLVVFPRWFNTIKFPRVTSYTWLTNSEEPITTFVGGKIHGFLTWLNMFGNHLGVWGGSAAENDIVDRDDGLSELMVMQHVTQSLGGAYDEDILEYGYDEDTNYRTWAGVVGTIAALAVPEWATAIRAATAIIQALLPESRYHASHYNWHIYPVPPNNVSMNVQDWMTLVDFFNEIGAEIWYPDGRHWLPSYKTTTDAIYHPNTLQGCEFDGFPVKLPICSKYVRLGYCEELIKYVNPVVVDICNIKPGNNRLAHAVSARGYIKDVIRRIFFQHNFGSLLNIPWIRANYAATLRRALDVCANYCLIPTKAQNSIDDYMWFDTQVHTTKPGLMQKWSMQEYPVQGAQKYYDPNICFPAHYNDAYGHQVLFLEEMFVPEIEWNAKLYGEFKAEGKDPEYWSDFKLKEMVKGTKYYVWNGAIIGRYDSRRSVEGQGGQLNTNQLTLYGLCHYTRNGAAIVYIPTLFRLISSNFTVQLRSIDRRGALNIYNQAAHHATIPLRFVATEGSDTTDEFQNNDDSFQMEVM